MKIKVTAAEILQSGSWLDFCNERGINEWAINEGLMDREQEFELTVEKAVSYGLIKQPPKNYW